MAGRRTDSPLVTWIGTGAIIFFWLVVVYAIFVDVADIWLDMVLNGIF